MRARLICNNGFRPVGLTAGILAALACWLWPACLSADPQGLPGPDEIPAELLTDTLLSRAKVCCPRCAFDQWNAAPVGKPASCSNCKHEFTAPPALAFFPKAPPLPPPAGQVVNVSNVGELVRAVAEVKPGGTIMLADGAYFLSRSLQIRTSEVTLRSASGRRDLVVLDCAKSQHHEGIGLYNCTGVTIADLTLRNVRQNGYKINSDSTVDRVTLYNVVGHNIWQRHVKGVPGPVRDGPGKVGSRGCKIQYCLFYNDRAKRLDDEPYERDNPAQFGGNYIGGIDVMNVRDWTISDNVFLGIRGRTGTARGAIFIWHDSRNVTIERNIIIDCDTGIAMGNSHRGAEWKDLPHCDGFVVRNNFVTRCPESNIVAAWTKDCRVVHNTVHDPQNRMGRLMRAVHDNPGLLVANNIFSGPPRLAIETSQGATVRDNLLRAVPEYFVDPARGDLHLNAKAVDAIDKARPMELVTHDIDRQRRGDRPDIGAHEYRN